MSWQKPSRKWCSPLCQEWSTNSLDLFLPLSWTAFCGHSPTPRQHAHWSLLSPSICSCVNLTHPPHKNKLYSLNWGFQHQSPVSKTINPCFLPMKDLAGKFNLTQVVTEPTKCTNDSLINHVYLFDASLLQSCLTLPPLCSSDHNCLLSNWIGSYLLQSSTSEPSGCTKELTSTLLPRNLKIMTVIIPRLTSTISGLTGKSLPSMSWPGTLPINELPSESLYPGSLMHCHSCSRNVIDYIKGLRPLILLLAGCPTERPGAGQCYPEC